MFISWGDEKDYLPSKIGKNNWACVALPHLSFFSSVSIPYMRNSGIFFLEGISAIYSSYQSGLSLIAQSFRSGIPSILDILTFLDWPYFLHF